MKKNSIQDIKRSTPSMHQSINHVHPHVENIDKEKIEIVHHEDESIKKIKRTKRSHFIGDRHANKAFKTKTFVLIIVSIVFLVAIYFVSLYFGHARVIINEKKEQFNFTDKEFKATRASQSPLPFEVMIVSDTIEKEITLTDSKQTSSKAVGQVVIYNTYSTQAQKLSINTRLVDDKGNIYMTDKAVTVPGYTMSKGKIVPGSVSIGITASVAGDKYNGEPRDFSLLGFKGTPKATKIYARSKGALTGGSTGLMYMPNSEQKGELNTVLSTDLKSKLLKNVHAQVPPDYILFDDSVRVETNFNPDSVLSPNANAVVKVTGQAFAIIFNERDLEKSVIKSANANIKDNEIEEISVPELHNFSLKVLDDIGSLNKDTPSIAFTLTGNGTLSWEPNYEQLKLQLVGISKYDANNIFVQDPGIDKARLSLIPPWQKFLPKNINYIKIKSE